MSAVLLLHPMSVFPSWVLWVMTACAVCSAGIGPLASWMRTTRIARALFVSMTSAAVIVLIIVDCWGLPDWLCYLVP